MRIPSRTQDRGFTFNITPLIDVVFLLIIFFLVASHFIRNEHLERIDLPLASQGKDEAESPSRLVVTVTPTGLLFMGTTPILEAEVEQRLQQLIARHGATATELRIRADRTVPYSKVEPLLLTAARNNVTRVRFSVLTE
ncbi:ExbD/TolR family protein [Schlesneria sp. T3-172]|uniref:ExbD/TolR family protein n=1 Tax=Schlesneria sphaerica TaxID=3373610 RepID=UPI0037C5594A